MLKNLKQLQAALMSRSAISRSNSATHWIIFSSEHILEGTLRKCNVPREQLGWWKWLSYVE